MSLEWRGRGARAADWLLPWGMGALFLWAAFRLSSFHVLPDFYSSDFLDYCLGMATLEDPALDQWPDRRSKAAALLAVPFQGQGILTSLYMGAQVAIFLTGAGIYQWARSLGGRPAGVAAVLLGIALGPNMAALRMLSFYPTLTATMVWAGALVAMTWRRTSPLNLLALGAAIGACLLVDVRGALWAFPALAAGLLAVVFGRIEWGKAPWSRPLALAILVLPVLLSWPLGELVYPDYAVTLEGQLDVSNLTNTPEYGENLTEGFVWGDTAPDEWLDTARTLLAERHKAVALIPEDARLQPPATRQSHLEPWLWPAVLSLLSAGALLARRPRLLAGFALSLLPFAVALYGAINGLDLQLRFLSHLAPALAVLLGLGVVGPLLFLAEWVQRREPRHLWAARAIQGLVLAVIGLAVFGILPSPLAPDAPWRRRWVPGVAQLRTAIEVRAGIGEPRSDEARTRTCAEALSPRSARFHPGG